MWCKIMFPISVTKISRECQGVNTVTKKTPVQMYSCVELVVQWDFSKNSLPMFTNSTCSMDVMFAISVVLAVNSTSDF